MILAATIDGNEIIVDLDARRAVVDKPFCDGFITTLDYTARNLITLSEHLRDQLSWAGITEFLEEVDPDRRFPELWWRGQKGITDPFKGV